MFYRKYYSQSVDAFLCVMCIAASPGVCVSTLLTFPSASPSLICWHVRRSRTQYRISPFITRCGQIFAQPIKCRLMLRARATAVLTLSGTCASSCKCFENNLPLMLERMRMRVFVVGECVYLCVTCCCWLCFHYSSAPSCDGYRAVALR